ncbi:hypothetical protein ABTY61_11920 [Kitasatospora sp. NPDC096128]
MLGLLILNLIAALFGGLCETRSSRFRRKPIEVQHPSGDVQHR